MQLPRERVVVIYNEHSSSAQKIESQVIEPLEDAAFEGGTVSFIKTPHADTDSNIEVLSERFDDNDIILACGGDGTAHTVANAIMHSDAEPSAVSFLGFGNINDAAHTFSGKKHLQDPWIVTRAHDDTQIVPVYPIEISKNNRLWRYALLYATIGLTARIAYDFNEGDTREHLKARPNNLLLNSLRSANFYYGARPDHYMPMYYLNGESTVRNDEFAFLNGPRMADIMRSNQPLYEDQSFLRTRLEFPPQTYRAALTASRLLMSRVISLGGEKRTVDTLDFASTASVALQADGEPVLFDDVDNLTFAKQGVPWRHLRVIKPQTNAA